MFFINEDIKKAASKCQKDHVCLSRESTNLCKVISSIDNNIMHVQCLHPEDCQYKHASNGRIICTCPVRNEIYVKYRV